MAFSRPLPFVAVLAAAALLAAGCGGDGAKTEQGNGVTRAGYIAKVNAVCATTARDSKPTNRRLQALVDGSGTYSSRLRKAAPLLRTTYELQQAKVARIKALAPPTKDRTQIAEVVKASTDALAQLRGAIPIARRGDLKSFIDVLFDANGTRARAERLGTTYGFRAQCFAVPIDLSTLSL